MTELLTGGGFPLSVTDLVKKSLAFGLGAAAFSAEKLKQFADEMVSRGEMSKDEAQRFINEMAARSEEDKRKIQEWVSEQVSKMLRQAGAAEAKRVELLEDRIAALETRLAELASEGAEKSPNEQKPPS
jgi:polyhydroxyalkanoate synthesis regulator phasin